MGRAGKQQDAFRADDPEAELVAHEPGTDHQRLLADLDVLTAVPAEVLTLPRPHRVERGDEVARDGF